MKRSGEEETLGLSSGNWTVPFSTVSSYKSKSFRWRLCRCAEWRDKWRVSQALVTWEVTHNHLGPGRI
jgi:hypothetical protein